jgi:branched-chain amino acid transport system permease protein
MENFLNILVTGILLGGIYALVSIGLNLIFGVIRVVNFAQGEFIMLGMYGTFALFNIAWLRLDPYLSIFIVVPALFLLGVAVQRFIIQPLQNEPMMQVFATFGLLMIGQNVILALTSGYAVSVRIDLAAKTFALGPVQVSVVRVIALLATTAIVLGLYWMLNNTMFGKAVRAVAQDRRAARLMGVNVERTFMLTFGIGAALAGLAGTLLSPIYTLSPQIGGTFILPAFAVVVLGGLGSVAGAYIGGFIVGLTETFAGYYLNPELKQAIWFMVFIVMLIVRPSGLFGMVGAEEVGLREQD